MKGKKWESPKGEIKYFNSLKVLNIEKVESVNENLEPEVTITQTDDQTTYEYSINGSRYMVKIVPAKGPAYYLLDLDGDGEFDRQEDDPARIVVPQWVLFRW